MFDEKKARRIIRKMPVTKSLDNGFAAEGWSEELPRVYRQAAKLLNECGDISKAERMHMEQILPMIAFYQEAQRLTGSKENALEFFERWAFVEAEKMVKKIRPLMNLGVYRLMPTICAMMLDRMFGKTAGFDYRAVPDAPKFAVDMTLCPYVAACRRYGCPELPQFACRADDITYGKLHPNLVWARTQTMGMGGSCCDFRLYVKKREE